MVFQLPQPRHRPSEARDTYPHSRQTRELWPRGRGRFALLGLARYEDVRRAEDDLADRQVIVFAV